MACSKCGASIVPNARFCHSCGTELTREAPHEERKRVSILFVDQVGSTARAEASDPEDVRQANRLYYEESRARIERFGGLLEKYAGDAVMAVFGAPLARSNDAENAVLAGLDVLDGVRRLNQANPGLDLEVRIGICTGEAVVEIDPPPESALATGDVVNTAARLQSAAPPGSIVVGPETYRLTRHAFTYRGLPPIEAKGKRDPVPAWVVVDRARPQGAPSASTPFVGRQTEVHLVRTLWERSTGECQPHLVSLTGPAGIGKSRLAHEFCAEVATTGARVLTGRCLLYEQQTPYHVVAQAVRVGAGIPESDTVEAAREKLAQYVASSTPPDESASMTRYLSLVLSLGLDERAGTAVDIQYATRRFFEQMGDERPLLLVLDDLQWADDASLDLVHYLATRLRDRPVMIVALARPELLETHPRWGAGVVTHTALALNPLSEADANEVVARLLEGAEPVTVAQVVATAEGSPLFLEELVASLQDETSDGDLPPTIWAVIAARIDALPPAARSVLLHASVVGKSFWRGVLDQIAEAGALDDALEALELRGLVQRVAGSRLEADVEYSFKHDLILEVSYATLPRSERRRLHALTAGALEGLLRQPTDMAALLGHHWLQGGDRRRARSYLLTAAARALDSFAVEETYDLYTQVLELSEDEAERLAARTLRAQALLLLGQMERAVAEYSELIPELDGEQRIDALINLATAAMWSERTEETMEAASSALELARLEGRPALEAAALGLVGGAYGMRGEPDDLRLAITLSEEAVAKWPPGERPRELAALHHLSSNEYYWAGEYEKSIEATNLAATVAGLDLHSREFLLRSAGMRGILLAATGRYEEALSAASEAIDLARDMGRAVSVVTNYSTLPLREIFDLDEALVRSEAVVDALGPSEFNMPWIMARADAFVARVQRGDLAVAERAWGPLWEHALASRAWERWLVVGRLAAARADLDLALGRLDDALTWARRALDLAVTGSRPKYEAVALTTLGQVLVRQGLREEGAGPLAQAVRLADRLGSPWLRWQARHALGDAARDGGAEAHAEAAEIVRSVAAGLSPVHAAGFLAAPRVAAALGAAP